MNTAAWYVVRTKARREEQVGAILQQRDVEFFLPMLGRTRLSRTGRRAEPLFPSYLFVRFAIPSDEYLRVRSAPGVATMVSFDGLPAAVPDRIVQAIKARLDVENCVQWHNPFQPGQRVVISDGPFKDVEAIFDGQLTRTGRVRVLVKLLDKYWRINVDMASLRPAEGKPKLRA